MQMQKAMTPTDREWKTFHVTETAPDKEQPGSKVAIFTKEGQAWRFPAAMLLTSKIHPNQLAFGTAIEVLLGSDGKPYGLKLAV